MYIYVHIWFIYLQNFVLVYNYLFNNEQIGK